MCNIDPKDIETWNTKSSSHTGGGGTHPGNNNNESGGCSSNNSCSSHNANGTIPPDPLIGIGGLSIEPETNKE